VFSADKCRQSLFCLAKRPTCSINPDHSRKEPRTNTASPYRPQLGSAVLPHVVAQIGKAAMLPPLLEALRAFSREEMDGILGTLS
jgi:hypothetical protein